MELTFWGVRGSISSGETPQEEKENIKKVLKLYNEERKAQPSSANDDIFIENFVETHQDKFLSHGSHTISIDVKTKKETQIIIDCGSGMLRLGKEFLNGPCGRGEGNVHIFLTHFHWDHLMGLPFFTPIYIKNNII